MDPDVFLREDYKQKITFLTNHMTCMWTRFNILCQYRVGAHWLANQSQSANERGTQRNRAEDG